MRTPQGNQTANGRPLRIIREVRMMPVGAGNIRVFKLACGHIVERLGSRDRHVGDRMGCPHCR